MKFLPNWAVLAVVSLTASSVNAQPQFTNGLWLQITNFSSGSIHGNLNGATDFVYEVYSTTNVAVARKASDWEIETELFPFGGTNSMPFNVSMSGRNPLFLWARDWTGITRNGNKTPDWWFYYWFGIEGLSFSDDGMDSDGNTLFFDYENQIDPNPLSFALLFGKRYVNTSAVDGTIRLLAGEPFYVAVLVNDPNESDAVWKPFTSTNLTIQLGATNGPYTLLIGLRGLPDSAHASWAEAWLTLNTVGPTISVTNPVGSTVTQPIIQLQGLVSESLSQLTFDVSNALGIIKNQQGESCPVFYDPNFRDFTTNIFQCYDIGVTNGLNTVTLHATDLAGNTTTASVNFTLDYASARPPVLSVLWPQNGTKVSGSSFTLNAQVDDDTASVTAQITDPHGNTNAVQGLVERSGLVWAKNLPLAAGTNFLTVTAKNAAGLSTTTNLTVLQSQVLVTMNPMTEFNKPRVSITGTVSDPTCTVKVNGVQAYYLDTNGDWKADNVPVSPTGTANFDLEIYRGK
ncbi:MAG TPA: hypothetical protein VGJ73_22635 [Verrucomicrobiae bacterium]|jgi:hypothetical protein